MPADDGVHLVDVFKGHVVWLHEYQLRFRLGEYRQAAAQESAARDGHCAEVRWRPRHDPSERSLRVARIVNCTGPDLDIARCGDTLLGALLSSGRIRADECRLGVDVDGESRVIGADGEAVAGLYAIGPMTRGAFWESIAVPDIAVQAQAVARRIAA